MVDLLLASTFCLTQIAHLFSANHLQPMENISLTILQSAVFSSILCFLRTAPGKPIDSLFVQAHTGRSDFSQLLAAPAIE